MGHYPLQVFLLLLCIAEAKRNLLDQPLDFWLAPGPSGVHDVLETCACRCVQSPCVMHTSTVRAEPCGVQVSGCRKPAAKISHSLNVLIVRCSRDTWRCSGLWSDHRKPAAKISHGLHVLTVRCSRDTPKQKLCSVSQRAIASRWQMCVPLAKCKRTDS